MFMQRSSVNIFESTPLNANANAQTKSEVTKAKIREEVIMPFSPFLSPIEMYFAVLREMIRGRPLATSVNKTIKIENDT